MSTAWLCTFCKTSNSNKLEQCQKCQQHWTAKPLVPTQHHNRTSSTTTTAPWRFKQEDHNDDEEVPTNATWKTPIHWTCNICYAPTQMISGSAHARKCWMTSQLPQRRSQLPQNHATPQPAPQVPKDLHRDNPHSRTTRTTGSATAAVQPANTSTTSNSAPAKQPHHDQPPPPPPPATYGFAPHVATKSNT